jgi:Ca-activated chloride channel homolog
MADVKTANGMSKNAFIQQLIILNCLSVPLRPVAIGLCGKSGRNAIFLCAVLLTATSASAQKTAQLLYDANELYSNGQFDKAAEKYKVVLNKEPDNATAHFNLASTFYKQNQFAEAQKEWAAVTGAGTGQQAQALYNQGVALAKQQKLEEAVEAFKAALKKDPADADCRYNLAKALEELKQKQKQPPPKEKNKKDPKQQQQKEQEEQPKPKPSKLNKQQVQQVLQMIRRKEKQVQQKVQNKEGGGIVQPEKDW